MTQAATGGSPYRTRVYRKGVLDVDGFDVEEVSDYLDEPDTVVWVDLCAPSAEQLLQLADELSLHELAVEDALGPHQRPKVDYYESHLFVACHAVQVDDDEGELRTTEIDAFATDRWLLTVRKDDGFSMDPVLRRWDRAPGRTSHGVSFMLYALLDVVVDGYVEAVQGFDDYYDTVGEAVFSETPMEPGHQRHWFEMRRALVRFHRLVVPMREVLNGLMRPDRDLVTEELYPYYHDVYDHVLRVAESTEALRDVVASLVETNLTLRDYRQNQIMRKVTSWAAIIAVPTLITGFYGMNVPYPGAGEPWGVWVSVTLITVLVVLLYALFRRRDWI